MPKGVSGNPNGRPKGIPNRATTMAREAIAAFVDNNAPLLQELLQEIREVNGAQAAFNCIRDLMEFHVPKLSRSEVKADIEVKTTRLDDQDQALLTQYKLITQKEQTYADKGKDQSTLGSDHEREAILQSLD